MRGWSRVHSPRIASKRTRVAAILTLILALAIATAVRAQTSAIAQLQQGKSGLLAAKQKVAREFQAQYPDYFIGTKF